MKRFSDFSKAKNHAETRNKMAVVMDGGNGYLVVNTLEAIELDKKGYETLKVYNSHL